MSSKDFQGRQLTMRPIELSEIAARHRLRLVGEDRPITTMNYLDSPAALRDQQLTYAVTGEFVQGFLASGIAACILPARLAKDVPNGFSVLVTDEDPEDVFFGIFAGFAETGAWQEGVQPSRGNGIRIAPTAVIHDRAEIGDDCRIMDHAVILPNTLLGNRVVVKPNAVIGADGFEVRRIDGRRRNVPHVGGVWIEDDVEVGSSTCVDRGLFGEFTYVGAETKIDSLVYVAHRVVVGRCCVIIGCSELSGGVVLGDGVWVSPSSAIQPRLTLGDYCFLGTGSVVSRSVPRHALAYGCPAKVHGWVCSCRTKLSFVHDRARCERCGAEYIHSGGMVTRVSESAA